MLTNNFMPMDPAVLKDIPQFAHPLHQVSLSCTASKLSTSVNVGYPSLIYKGSYFASAGGDDLEVKVVESGFLCLSFVDHEPGRPRTEINMYFPDTSEDLLSLSNGALAQLMLTDEHDYVQVMATNNFVKTTNGQMGTFNKRYLEIILETSDKLHGDFIPGEHLHTFWCGDLVKTPSYGEHTSSPQKESKSFEGGLAAYGNIIRGDEDTSEDEVARTTNPADATRLAACWNAFSGVDLQTIDLAGGSIVAAGRTASGF